MYEDPKLPTIIRMKRHKSFHPGPFIYQSS